MAEIPDRGCMKMAQVLEILLYTAAGMAGSWLALAHLRYARGLVRCPLCRGTGSVPDGTVVRRHVPLREVLDAGRPDPGLPPDRPHNAMTAPVDVDALREAVGELRVALQSEAACTCRHHGLGPGKAYRCLRCLTLDATAHLGGAA